MSTNKHVISPRKSTAPEQLLLDIDPNLIVFGDLPNRDPISPKDPEFQTLVNSIRAAGGNVQPVKVRLTESDPPQYELIFGHRRVLACRYLNMTVKAIIASSLSSVAVLAERVAENFGRVPFRPIELGRLASHAVQSKAYPSLRKFAEAVDIDNGMISKAAALAQLPEVVLAAFPSVLKLQYGHAKPLSDAVACDRAGVEARALELCKADPRLPIQTVLDTLIGNRVESFNTPRAVLVDGEKVGTFKTGKSGITVSLNTTVAPPDLGIFLAAFETWLKVTSAVGKRSKTDDRNASNQQAGQTPRTALT
ncbi:MAG: ParB/RepB/Spo0J family partition protein [Pseudomonadota bacterium]